MFWIKEVELIESVDYLKSSCFEGTQLANFEVFDAEINSAQPNHPQVQIERKEEQKAPKRGPFPSRKTDRLPDFRSLEPIILSRIMPTFLQLFLELIMFRNSIQYGTEFYDQ